MNCVVYAVPATLAVTVEVPLVQPTPNVKRSSPFFSRLSLMAKVEIRCRHTRQKWIPMPMPQRKAM